MQILRYPGSLRNQNHKSWEVDEQSDTTESYYEIYSDLHTYLQAFCFCAGQFQHTIDSVHP